MKKTLKAPVLPQTSGQGIGIQAARQLMVRIEPYPSMDSGDLIELYWDGCYIGCRTLEAGDVGLAIDLKVPESFIQSGVARAHYRVMRIGHDPQFSDPCVANIKLDCPGGLTSLEENQSLAPLQVPEPILRYGLNSGQIKRGVPLTIEPYLNMAVDDEITLRWGDVRLDLPKLDDHDIGQPIRLFVPAPIIQEAGDDPRLEVTYCILDRVGNTSHWAPPRQLKVGNFRIYRKVVRREGMQVCEPRYS